MNFLPLTQPVYGISITETALSLVEASKGWRTRTFNQVKQVPLPPGLLKLSSAKPNILKPDEFQEQLRLLTENLKTPASVALSLPDLCARTSVFEFSQFPKKAKEQTALVNWRFQQDLKLDTSQSRLDYGVYVPMPKGDPSATVNPDLVRVLGAAMRIEIVEQFELVCLGADILPVSVGLAGLDIFDLYQPMIQERLEVEDRRSSGSHTGGMFLYLSNWGFSFLAFQDGCPKFIRTKAVSIRSDSPDPNPDTAGADRTSSLSHPVTDCHYPFYIVDKVSKEILATIQFYLESISSHASLPPGMNVFVVTDVEQGMELFPSMEHVHQTVKACSNSETSLHMTQLSAIMPLNFRKGMGLSESEAGSALPGFARLRVA